MTGALFDIVNLTYARRNGEETFRIHLPRFRVMPGERVALTGPSGSGKTTVLDVLALLAPAETADRFTFRDRPDAAPTDLRALDARGYVDRLAPVRAAAVGYVPQRGGLLPFLDARRNILAGPEHLGRPVDTARLDDLCPRLDIAHVLDRKPAELSIGEQQRVAICRALLGRPRVVIADEPTASLDPENADRVLALFTAAAREAGVALVIASHDHDRARAHGFTLCPREAGQTGADGRHSVFRHGTVMAETSLHPVPEAAS